ncbi:MAG: threonine synthase [Rhodothalassiaceae bacterium]
MKYLSTRSGLSADFASVVASGLAPDGGLYLPERFPVLDSATRTRLGRSDYAEAVAVVGSAFGGDALDGRAWRALGEATAAAFRHGAVAPLSEIDAGHFLLELFHGPTLSFKDYGLQPLARLLSMLGRADKRPLFILGATSGDTGSAAIEAFRGREDARIAILHPHGRVSDIQRRQMTTVTDPNVLNLAIEGSFDDCQRIAKAVLLARAAKGEETVLSVNSINWGRLLFQTAYHVHTACRLAALGRPLALSVPSGNFGNALSAIIAAMMGAPIAHLVVASNANDALTRFFREGHVRSGKVEETLSPAMDIQIPSNLERFLHLLAGRDPDVTSAAMIALRETGELARPEIRTGQPPMTIEAASIGDEDILATIARLYRETDRILDPHSAVAVAAMRGAQALPGDALRLSVATAHPAKFGEAVARALGFAPPLPAALSALVQQEERYEVLPADEEHIEERIAAFLKALP